MTPLDAIAARQHPDGSWHAPPDDGGLTTAVTLIALRYAGLLEEGEAQAMATALRGRVLPDGTVGAYPGAPRGSASATTLVSTALRAAGREPLAKAAPPQDLLLRVICEPGRHRRLLPTALLALPAFQRLLDDALGFSGLVGAHLLLPLLRPPVSARGRRAVVDYLVAHQDRQGSWASIGAITAVGLMALRAAGASRDDPAVGRAAAFLRASLVNRHGGRDMPPCSCAVWDTAQAVRLLASQGRDVARGIDWLLRHRCMARPPTDWQRARPGAPRRGGWAFEPGGEFNADTDTTTTALHALTAAGIEGPAVNEALRWLLAMQNPDGGWPAFTWGQPEKPRGPLGRHPPGGPRSLRDLRGWLGRTRAELGDPSTAELTGRVLQTLGAMGIDARHPQVAAAVAFLRRHQWRGVWWGRWTVVYIGATADVLLGLHAVGLDPRLPFMRQAAERLRSWQNEDGGWGETPESYRDPALAGVGPSSAFHTGQAVRALARMPGHQDAVDRGRAWLRDALQLDGRWPGEVPLGTLQPPSTAYTMDGPVQAMAAEALLPIRRRAAATAQDRAVCPRLDHRVPWRFRHRLRLAAPASVVFDALADVRGYGRWWPGLEVEELTEDRGPEAPQVHRVTFGTPLGYRLSTRFVQLEAVRPRRLVGFVEGDLEGHGRFDLIGSGGVTDVVFDWQVVTTRAWMNRAAALTRPLLRANHDRVMRRFALGLARGLGVPLLDLHLSDHAVTAHEEPHEAPLPSHAASTTAVALRHRPSPGSVMKTTMPGFRVAQ